MRRLCTVIRKLCNVASSLPSLPSCCFASPFDRQMMTIIQTIDQATAVLTKFSDSTDCKTYVALSELSNIPVSTLWHRAHGRQSRKEKAKGQQYLTPSEEKALVDCLLRMSNNGFPIPVKFLCSSALIIVRQRSSVFQALATNGTIRALSLSPASQSLPLGAGQTKCRHSAKTGDRSPS
jgi:hypothetical protein